MNKSLQNTAYVILTMIGLYLFFSVFFVGFSLMDYEDCQGYKSLGYDIRSGIAIGAFAIPYYACTITCDKKIYPVFGYYTRETIKEEGVEKCLK